MPLPPLSGPWEKKGAFIYYGNRDPRRAIISKYINK